MQPLSSAQTDQVTGPISGSKFGLNSGMFSETSHSPVECASLLMR